MVVQVIHELERFAYPGICQHDLRKTTKPSQSRGSLHQNLHQKLRLSQTLNSANPFNAAFNEAIIRVNKHFQTVSLLYLPRGKSIQVNACCLAAKNYNWLIEDTSYDIPIHVCVMHAHTQNEINLTVRRIFTGCSVLQLCYLLVLIQLSKTCF
jgi:hypothetical protein